MKLTQDDFRPVTLADRACIQGHYAHYPQTHLRWLYLCRKKINQKLLEKKYGFPVWFVWTRRASS